MKINIDLDLLHDQVRLCMIKANEAKDPYECNLFTGIENLLGEIVYALEYGDDIEILSNNE